MPLYVYVCDECRARRELFRPVAQRNDPVECESCRADSANPHACRRDLGLELGDPRPASSGEIVSVNGGVGITQVASGNADLQRAGFAPHEANYDGRGDLHCKDRNTYLRVLYHKGLHNKDETRGGRG